MIKNSHEVFKFISHGVYIISVDDGKKQNAFTAAWVMQVSFDPLLICFSINPNNHSYKLLKQGKKCCISVLNSQQFVAANHFGHSSETDKMTGYSWLPTKTGAPALSESLAYFDCYVDHYSAAGDHELVVCKVVDATILNQGKPMLYSDTDNMDMSSELHQDKG